jgi:hypothetical protein
MKPVESHVSFANSNVDESIFFLALEARVLRFAEFPGAVGWDPVEWAGYVVGSGLPSLAN